MCVICFTGGYFVNELMERLPALIQLLANKQNKAKIKKKKAYLHLSIYSLWKLIYEKDNRDLKKTKKQEGKHFL